MKRIRIRAGSGLGDSLYLQAVVRHMVLVDGRNDLEVCTPYPELFKALNGAAVTVPFTKLGVSLVSHYVTGKRVQGTDQFQDMNTSVGLRKKADLKLDWDVGDLNLVETVLTKAAGRPVALVALPRNPMDRIDGFGKELSPDWAAVQLGINEARARGFYVVQVGKGTAIHTLGNIDLDLANTTTVAQLVDLAAAVATVFIGIPSFFIPLSESFSKPCFIVFSRRGLESKVSFISAVTPAKVIHRKDICKHVVDDWELEKIKEVAGEVLNLGRDSYQVSRQAGGDRGQRTECATEPTEAD